MRTAETYPIDPWLQKRIIIEANRVLRGEAKTVCYLEAVQSLKAKGRMVMWKAKNDFQQDQKPAFALDFNISALLTKGDASSMAALKTRSSCLKLFSLMKKNSFYIVRFQSSVNSNNMLHYETSTYKEAAKVRDDLLQRGVKNVSIIGPIDEEN